MSTESEKIELEEKIQKLIKEVKDDKTVSTMASIAALGAASLGSLATPVAGALLGAAGAGIAANYLYKLISEKRTLNEQIKNLELMSSTKNENT